MGARFGRRLRRGATTTAVAAAAVAALSASQAPGITHATAGEGPGTNGAAPDVPPSDESATGDSPYYTDLPPLRTPGKPATSIDLPATGPAEAGIPATVLAAYKRAEATIAASDPGCRVPWQLLAAIGKVESGQARGGRVDAQGTTLSPILGPVLNGVGFANISDTDNGAYDGDSRYDRAVGPMQFIPSTWATWGQDANGDGRRDPNNVYDAALAAGRYLCAGNRDLTVAADLDAALLSYNRSREYVRTVLSWYGYYKRGSHTVPDGRGVLPGSETPDSNTSGNPSSRPPLVEPSTPSTPGTSTPDPTTPDPGTTPSPKPTPDPDPDPDPAPSPRPTTPGTPGPKPPRPPGPIAPLPASVLVNAGAAELSGTAGHDFAERFTVRVKNALGRPVAEQDVRFDIVGSTDTVFADGRRTAVVPSGRTGDAAAPVLKSGERTGSFTLRATLAGGKVPPVEVRATVTERVADAVELTEGKDLTAAPGTAFAGKIAVLARYEKAAAAKVSVTATFIKPPAEGADPVENDKGPHFKHAQGKAVRTLTGLLTDTNGGLELPELHADEHTGTFHLLLTFAGGHTLTVELTVAPTPAATSTPTATATP
jgi:hypothetical protein